MNSKFATLLAASVLLASAGSVQAQDPEKPESIVLEAKTGSVLASAGGDYQSAEVGKQFVEGESVMVTDGAKATVVYYYDDGKRKCTEVYKGPQTFIIDDSCVKAAALVNGRPLAGAGIIIGSALVGAAILGNMDKAPVAPLSAGPSGTEINHGP